MCDWTTAAWYARPPLFFFPPFDMDVPCQVMSIIVYWGGAHANPNPKLKEVATSVVAFRSSDDGFTWEYSGSILDAAQVPDRAQAPRLTPT